MNPSGSRGSLVQSDLTPSYFHDEAYGPVRRLQGGWEKTIFMAHHGEAYGIGELFRESVAGSI